MQFHLVFGVDIQVVQVINLFLFDSLHTVPVLINRVARPLAILKIVETGLLGDFFILADLLLNSLFVADESFFLFLLHLAFALLVLLLINDDAFALFLLSDGDHELHVLLVEELLVAGGLQLNSLSLFFLLFSDLLRTVLTLVLLVGALGAQLINLSLTVGSLLLRVTQKLNFTLLLVSLALGLLRGSLFSGKLLFVVLDDAFFFLTFLLLALGLSLDRNSVGCQHLLLDFSHFFCFFNLQGRVLRPLTIHLLALFFLLAFDGLQLPLSLLAAFLHLLHDGQSTLTSILFSLKSALVLLCQVLQTVHFHHLVETVVLILLDVFETLDLSKLLVANRDNLTVEDHRVHALDVIFLFVQHLLRFCNECCIFGCLLLFSFGGRHLG